MSGKRYKEAKKLLNDSEVLSVEKAISVVKKNSTAKFDETIELAINLGVDTRHSDLMVRGVCSLPYGTGMSMIVGVFWIDQKAE